MTERFTSTSTRRAPHVDSEREHARAPARGFVDDPDRTRFLAAQIRTAHEALEAGVNLRGYYVWSLLDNFEWANGYGPRFGIVRVDFHSSPHPQTERPLVRRNHRQERN